MRPSPPSPPSPPWPGRARRGRLCWLLRLGGLASLLIACGAPRPEGKTPPKGGGLQVITTFPPITLLTRAVAGECAERYGLKGVFLVDVPEMTPTPADPRRAFSALARDLGLRVSVFDPMETGDAEAARDPATYFEVMRRNGAQLVAAFGG